MKTARQIELKGYVRALQPIIHLSGQKQGMGKTRISNIIEQRFICADGAEISVPKINGNAVRGILRDHVATAYCLANNIQFSSIEAFNLLFSGGMPLDKKNKNTEEKILNDLSSGKPKTKSKAGAENFFLVIWTWKLRTTPGSGFGYLKNLRSNTPSYHCLAVPSARRQ